MSPSMPYLEIAPAPRVSSGLGTRRLMWEVLVTLIPVVATAAYYFGAAALLLIVATTTATMGTEWLLTRRSGKGSTRLGDGSAALSGILLGLCLPPSTPLWMALLGGAVAIILGKAVWGGLGFNLFNPALVGRAFLQAAFPLALTTWTAPQQGFWTLAPSVLAPPFMRAATDATTTATPLGLAKFAGTFVPPETLILGGIAGSLGETSALVLVLCGLWLGLRRVFDWRLPVATLLTAALFSGVLQLWGDVAPGPLFTLTSGGLLLGAVYMVTDPVTTPLTPRGMWIFGAGVGFLVVLIRTWGGLAEGVMYAILLMNAVTPLINRLTQPRTFGTGMGAK
ncbi:MAG: RnfABCDGE type electron transport complex subunit D [bacterium]|nr:RnfABCDGE type electron transport complex subunit D [bacterium]